MELLLVRHAIAMQRDPKRWPDDRKRPLSPRGSARARTAALGLKRITAPPLTVLASPLLRTWQTAAILTRVAGWPPAARCTQLLPGASPEALLDVLARSKAARIALVGHEPDLGQLVAACLPVGTADAAFGFRKMGVALVKFEGPARAGRGSLVWFATPKLLRAAR